jgi:FtsZ-interacting cell division protein YlmF
MQFLGLYDNEDYEESDEYSEEQSRMARKQKPQTQARRKEESYPASPGLILFKGVPSDSAKYRLSESLKDGAMILLDLHELDAREMEEQGRPFITFMGGVAYARGGRIEFIEPAQYLVMPRDGMFEEWVEEGPGNDGAFNRQGR